MKLSGIVTGIALAITGVVAQVTSPMQDYNVTSPVSNFPYVAGQVLPCTWQIFANVNSALALTISLKSTTAGSNATYTISGGADVSKTGSKTVNNVTVYEHSYNYNIPTTVTTGPYNVVFLDTTTNTETNIPITILPVASSSAVAAASATASGGSAAAATTTNAQSVYKNGVESMSPSKAALALGAIAAIAYAL